ncbi:hypothetical protein AVEN_115506-1 [Araneus ventricosus]|uniref:Uncharacterized protein n=1 Tax=Araneus ventricosus TaxID=182803 RepID=A0A4Y2CK68_ARAVE|nr:hypothetical protein AVEN_115506-1 [Araneus ventricosus]
MFGVGMTETDSVGFASPFQPRIIPAVDNWIRTTLAIYPSYHVCHWISYLSFAEIVMTSAKAAQLDPSLYTNTSNGGSVRLLPQGAYQLRINLN